MRGGLGNRLTIRPGPESKAGVELPEDQVQDEGRHDERNDAPQQVEVPHENQIADPADGAEAGALGEEADDQGR